MTFCPVAHRLITTAPSLDLVRFPAFAIAIGRASHHLLAETKR